MDEPSEYIDFVARYGDWVAVKKMAVRKETRPEEVVFHLSGIRNSFDRKAFSLMGVNADMLDEFSRGVSKKSKTYSELGKALSALDSKEAKEAIAKSCDKKVSRIAEIYLLCKVMADSGFDTSITQQMLSKMYPDLKLKIPKLGRPKKG
ncbi:MAG: DUF2666 domain-containing protein [Candidatus Marsarchaeota archaeon]|nr:DUF2666 domain-containing protein [Candidatus Marsarchaeota archaeon]MCL5106155.1 DUF2666 domain-containing protein [Candidatus Marsarchaeota archaeon]